MEEQKAKFAGENTTVWIIGVVDATVWYWNMVHDSRQPEEIGSSTSQMAETNTGYYMEAEGNEWWSKETIWNGQARRYTEKKSIKISGPRASNGSKSTS